ncbi:DUF4238 domain-containing protein [Paenibacillus sp. ClWae2A]|uniref:DUF4238 domain-containing protein n=1 Tax=Paenibacillus sp. ClWae2A TaxID=3057177 RepID=UPI0028F52D69|nr:DUF4238 domain-containing protein [Paenibacillus sp. ClWae2A]MDT9722803.1 DUF4238 domain-containing protein [Paenibacillus sp. ClWae2A]
MEKKRKQHYVWEYYLTAWASNQQVYCLRDHKIFPTNTENILQERDFYRIGSFNLETIELIKQLLAPKNNSNSYLIKDMIEDYFSVYFEIESKKMDSSSADILINNYIEDLHSKVESEAKKYIESLRNKNIEFYKDEFNRIRFTTFIMAQYLRTNKMRNNFISNMNTPDLIEKSLKTHWKDPLNGLKEAWPIFHVILSSMLAAGLALQKYNCVLLEISGECEFITGDQPVINTKSIGINILSEVKELEFYYPITNKLAVLLTDKNIGDKISLSCEHVDAYNKLIMRASDKALVATNKELLDRYRT